MPKTGIHGLELNKNFSYSSDVELPPPGLLDGLMVVSHIHKADIIVLSETKMLSEELSWKPHLDVS